jgi:hypothetical protein
MGNVGKYTPSGEFVEENPLYEFEADYWGNCCNSLDEEIKQFFYAKLMSIDKYSPFSFSVNGKKILDIGGGPVSLLLKCHDHGGSKVVDPIKYPKWTIDRYASNNIEYDQKPGEDVDEEGYDEVWIYNCLQHVIDPEKIINNAKKAAPVIRIFEWIDIPAHEGHPHELKEDKLNKWLGGKGSVGIIKYDEYSSVFGSTLPVIRERTGGGGACYYGVFKHKL